MPVTSLHAFLIHPGKNNLDAPGISGNALGLEGKLFKLLDGIFSAEPDARDFAVTFNPAPDGTQQNECRDLLIAYYSDPSVQTGLKIAERLQNVTDNRSGMGLLFLIGGTRGLKHRLVVSRFPADQAILAEVDENGLDVEFLEQVFIRRMSAYKALLVEHQNPSAGFWNGVATDRQAGGSAENISNYWITDFLNADFSETPAAGTRRLAEALKKAVKANPSLEVKSEIASAASLAKGIFSGKQVSINSFCDHFGFSKPTRETIVNQLSKPSLAGKLFVFQPNEFADKLPYRTVEMDNGAMLTAPSDEFNKVFEVREAPNQQVEYATRGRVTDQRMARR